MKKNEIEGGFGSSIKIEVAKCEKLNDPYKKEKPSLPRSGRLR